MDEQEMLEAARQWWMRRTGPNVYRFSDGIVMKEMDRVYEGGWEGFKQDMLLGSMS